MDSDPYDDLPDLANYPVIKFGPKRIDVRELLSIDPENLVNDYRTIHHWIAVAATKVAGLSVTVAHKKRELIRLDARISRAARRVEKKPTEASVKNLVVLDPSYQDAQEELAKLEALRGGYQILLVALENKRDLVVNMGAELRKRKSHDSAL